MAATGSRCAEFTGDRLLALIDAGTPPLVIDVRSRREFRAGHVPGAVHIPFWRIAVADIPASVDDPIIVYCGHGPRAVLALGALRRRGFRRLASLAGHMAKWHKAGLREEVG